MNYNIYLLNADGSATLITQAQDLASAETAARAAGSGTQCRIEFGDITQSTVVEVITNG